MLGFGNNIKDFYLETFTEYVRYVDKDKWLSQKNFTSGYYSFLINNYSTRNDNINNYSTSTRPKNLERMLSEAKNREAIEGFNTDISSCNCSPWRVKINGS